ncbi:MAG TPA: hypothetical protein VD788_07430 [Candidatus Polarisedimenticolaceae bacterium]|nr:hypothetical protein [Candidatus Polarisedimenticolaceae bacterium]
MKEVLPGVHHWTALHPKIKIAVSSYYLADERVLIDPLWPDAGFEPSGAGPTDILLTNRHHYRDSRGFVERYGCTVWCAESGMHEFTHGERVRPLGPGDRLPAGITAHAIGAICPDETAFSIARGAGLLALGDGVVRRDDGPLGFVPDAYMGDDPESVKDGLRRAFAALGGLRFDHLLLAHGWPWIGGGKAALLGFSRAG